MARSPASQAVRRRRRRLARVITDSQPHGREALVESAMALAGEHELDPLPFRIATLARKVVNASYGVVASDLVEQGPGGGHDFRCQLTSTGVWAGWTARERPNGGGNL